MASLGLLKEHQIKMNVYYVFNRVIQLKSETKMAIVLGMGIIMQRLGEKEVVDIANDDLPDLDDNWQSDEGLVVVAEKIKFYL